MSKLAALKEKQEQVKKEIEDNAKDALGEAFTELFAAHPNISAIRWRQYTPYFNDGDACVFGVNDFEYLDSPLTEEAAEAAEYEGDWKYTWNAKDAAAKAVSELGKLCDSEVMLAAFGDHVTVMATRKGFDVSEYSHD